MTNDYAKWKIMVYISADGLLANFAVESLKQLKRAAGGGVVVVARLDTNEISHAKQYIFAESNALSSLDSKAETADPPAGVKVPSANDLMDFINKAVETPPQAKHHALFLWGHGPELLSNEGPRNEAEAAEERKNPGNPIERRYLTPSELKEALSKTELAKQEKKIDILGLDACSMSMAEIATELEEYVNYMVASQDDVPDQSFPYGDILFRLREPTNADDASDASKMITEEYRKAYLDYITNARTGFRAFTLSAVDLADKKMKLLTDALKTLANTLLQLSLNPGAGRKIFEARRNAQGFVFGLFVDIVDLCDKLEANDIDPVFLNPACAKVREAINGMVINNCVHKSPVENDTPAGVQVDAIHGLSIYFPYRIPDKTEELQELRKGGRQLPSKERDQRIKELEQVFAKLQEFQKTDWNKFIREGWSSILAGEAAEEAKKGHLILDEVLGMGEAA